MKILAVLPVPLIYTKFFLRVELLGLELVAEAARKAGHDVRLMNLQMETWQDYFRILKDWRPNVPEIIDLAKMTKSSFPKIFIVAGGHSWSKPNESSTTNIWAGMPLKEPCELRPATYSVGRLILSKCYGNLTVSIIQNCKFLIINALFNMSYLSLYLVIRHRDTKEKARQAGL